MKKTCPYCGNKFVAGENGTLDPLGCDKCFGFERDNTSDHAFWTSDEKFQTRESVETGKIFVITREQAFGQNADAFLQ